MQIEIAMWKGIIVKKIILIIYTFLLGSLPFECNEGGIAEHVDCNLFISNMEGNCYNMGGQMPFVCNEVK